MFGLVIADRGSEFSYVERIEHGKNGVKRLSLYFCDPMQSQQKGRAERCHEELRRILPKGKTNFEALTCRDMAACMSHVNSYSRPSLQDKSPCDLFAFLHGTELLDQLAIHRIPANEILLKPRLIP